MGKIINKLIIMLLIICLSITTVIENVSGSELTRTSESKDTPKTATLKPEKQKLTKKERVIKKTSNSTTFQKEDGTKELVMYAGDVRFTNEEGELVDYDPSLVTISAEDIKSYKSLSRYKYQNKQGDKKHYLPKQLTQETPILMRNDTYEIAFRPVFANEEVEASELKEDDSAKLPISTIDAQNSDKEMKIDEVLAEVDQSSLPNESDLEAVALQNQISTDLYDQTTEQQTKITYATEDKNIQLEYISQDTGIKENIILNEKPDSNIFLYELSLKDMVPRMNILDGGITLYNKKTGDIVGGIEAPYMNDATNSAYSQELYYTLGKKEGKEDTYILALTVSDEYLSNKNRVYPVTIDPTVEWYGSEEIWDAYIINKSPYDNMNFYSSGVTTFSVGDGAQGLFRTYLRFKDFTLKIDNKYIHKATLSLYETGNGGSGGTVEAHRVKADWKRDELTWKNRPDYAAAIYDTFKTSGTKGTVRTLNLTDHAREIANGTYTSYGIMLRDTNESSSGVYSQYYSARSSSTSYKPKLLIEYYDGPASATTVNVNNNYIKTGQSTTVNWEGITSKSLNRVEYRLATYDDKNKVIVNDQYKPYSSSTLIGSTSSGSKVISGSNTWPEGCYRIYVRGVDNGGIKGTGIGTTFHIDGTAPTLSSISISNPTTATSSTKYSNIIPTLKWTASDDHFGSIEYKINSGSYKQGGTTASGTCTIDSSAFTTPGLYTITVRAKDKASNYSATKTLNYYYDKTAPVIGSVTTEPSTGTEVYSNNATPTLKWSGISELSLSKIEYSMNGSNSYTAIGTTASGNYPIPKDKLSASGIYTFTLKAMDTAGNSSTKTISYHYDNIDPTIDSTTLTPTTSSASYTTVKTPKLTWKATDVNFKNVIICVDGKAVKTLTTASGSYDIDAANFPSYKKYVISVQAFDKANNSSQVTSLDYYCDPNPPIISNINLEPVTSSVNYSYNKTPTIKWSVVSDNFKVLQYSINGSAYAILGTTASGTKPLENNIINATGKYTIKVKATDQAGFSSSEATIDYYYENPFPNAASYQPTAITVDNKAGYKPIIKWSRTATSALPSDISYEIYRSTQVTFTPSADNLVASDIKDNYWCDISATSTQVFYQIKAVRKKNGVVIGSSDYSGYSFINNVTMDSTKRVGNKPNLGYQSLSLPIGSGSIEKSSGNVNYSQTDITLPNPQLPITLTRNYNSGVKAMGMFGLGWDFGMNAEIMRQVDSNGVVNLIYKDSSGALYSFVKNSSGIYTCNKASDLEFREGNTPTTVTVAKGNHAGTYSYVCAYELSTKDNLTYKFNSGGQLVSMSDLNNNFNLFLYDQVDGKLLKIISSNEQALTFIYGTNGRLVNEIKLADGTSLLYSYDTSNRLTGVTRKDNTTNNSVTYTYQYNSSGLLTGIIDAENNTYSLAYNGEKAIKFTQPNGDNYNLTYDSTTKTTITKKNSSNVTLYSEYVVYDLNSGNVKEDHDAAGNVIKYEYNANDLLTKTTKTVDYASIVNNTVEFRTKEVVNSTSYDVNNNISKEVDEEGNTTTYSYTSGNQASDDFPTTIIEKDADGTLTSDESLDYDSFGNLISTEDEIDGSDSSMTYDANGNVIQSIDNNNDLEANNITSQFDSNGNETNTSVISGTVEATEINKYENPLGLITYSKDVNSGIETYYQYDLLGRVTKTRFVIPNGTGTVTEEETKAYNKNGSLLSETDRAGVTTTYQYDNMNRLVKRTISKDSISVVYNTTYSYGNVTIYTGSSTMTVANAYVETETNKDGYITSQKYYDKLGHLIREKKSGIYTDYTYDRQGKVLTSFMIGVKESDPSLGKLSLNLYDEAGNNTNQIINPNYKADTGKYTIDSKNTIVTSSVFDSTGNVTSETDGLGNATGYEYDATSRLTKVTMPGGTGVPNVTSYNYESPVDQSNQTITTTTTNASGQISESIENAAGQLLSVKDVGNGTNPIKTSYEYDDQGRKTKQILNNGDYQILKYDTKQRLSALENYRKDGKKETITRYSYDIYDNIKTMIDYKDTNSVESQYRYTRYEYDALKRLIGFYETSSSAVPTDEVFNAKKIIYTYDIESNLEKITYQDAQDKIKGLSFQYNSDKWLSKINAQVQEGTELKSNLLREYTYHNDGKVEYIKDYPAFMTGGTNYIRRSYQYDVFDRVVEMKYASSSDLNQMLESYHYTYDKNSNILTEKLYKNYPTSIEKMDTLKEYTYDKLGRLTNTKVTDNLKGTNKVSNISYNFDEVGNRLKMTEEDAIAITTTTYTYNTLNQLEKSKTVKKDKTTAAETITSDKIYTYDANGNQQSETDSITKESTTNTYDVNNQLIKLVKKTNNIVTLEQTNEYNGSGQRIRKTENGTSINYYYQDGVVLYTTDGVGKKTSFNLMGESKNVIATERYSDTEGSSTYLYNKDVHTSTTSLIDSNSQGVIGYSYDDYGKTESSGNVGFYNEICYTGGIYDKSTRLYYLNARYYNPEDGRFLTQDTARGDKKEPTSLMLYQYCENNPINYMDPSGHWKIWNNIKNFASGVGQGFVGYFTDTARICKDLVKIW